MILPAKTVLQELDELNEQCERAIARAVRKTLIEHKLLGQPIVVDDGNGPSWIPAEEIEIPEPVDESRERLPPTTNS